jgi:thiosulfate dehydrogenase (quinone) large subunit
MKLPHLLRVVIFLLRVALGVNFFYIGFGVLFSAAVGADIRAHSFGDLYSWLAAPAAAGDWVHPFTQWAFLVIGICLAIGLLTRIASIAGIVLVLLSYLPTVSYSAPSISQFISDEVIVIICLLIIVLSGAGTYLGLDSFIHIHPPKKKVQ